MKLPLKLNSTIITVVATVALLGGAYTLGYFNGRSSVQAKWDKANAQQLAQDHEVLLLGMKDSFDTGVEHEEQKQQIQYITKTITKEVPVYIKDTSTCPVLPDGFSQLYNRAVQAVNTGIATGQFDDPASAAGEDAGAADSTASAAGVDTGDRNVR